MDAMIALLLTLLLTPTAALPREESTLVNEMARLTVKYERGVTRILRVERVPLASPQKLRRWRGRFEARAVAAGGKVIDFVRFDFPLMAQAETPDDTTAEAAKVGQKLREHVTATTLVKVPLPAGATSVVVYDGATKKTVAADLPAPAAPVAPGTSSPPPAAAGDGNTKR
jgi:hypothetical protein